MATVLLVLLLTLPVLTLPSARAAASADEDVKLGEFIPATPPQPAPETPAFSDTDGKPVALTDFTGRPTLVNLWATWCQPCLKEMPSLDRLQAQLGDKLRVAAVSEDHGGGAQVKPFVARLGIKNLTVYLDPKAVLEQAFHVRGLPTSIVIDAKGRVVGKVEGPAEWDSSKMLGVLMPFLKGGAGDAPMTHAFNQQQKPG